MQIETYTGRMIDLQHMTPGDIDICDIAHALSNTCRFNGHCRKFYSVAQHSVLVMGAINPRNHELRMAALLHDAAEAYVGDLISPIKRHMNEFCVLEGDTMTIILAAFGLTVSPSDHALIYTADMMAIATEKRDLMGPADWDEFELPEPFPYLIVPVDPPAAEAMFLSRYSMLNRRRCEACHTPPVRSSDRKGECLKL